MESSGSAGGYAAEEAFASGAGSPEGENIQPQAISLKAPLPHPAWQKAHPLQNPQACGIALHRIGVQFGPG